MCTVKQKTWVTNMHISSWGQFRQSSALFQLSCCVWITTLSLIYLVPCFPHFCALYWWVHCKMDPSIVMNRYVVFLSVRRLWCALLENMSVLDKLCSKVIGARVALAVNSMSVKQQCRVSKVSLNRNTYWPRLCTDQLMKMCEQRLTGTWPSISLRSSGSLFASSVFLITS